MRTFDRQHYVGSLRTKQGEFDSVLELAEDVRSRFTPLWELQPSDATEEGEDPNQPLDDVIAELPEKISVASNGLEGFLDCSLVEPARRHSSGEHPLKWLCEQTAARGTSLTPVVTLQSDTEYLNATSQIHDALNSDAAVRIAIPELAQVTDIAALIKSLGLQYDALHLIVDCEHLAQSVANLLPTLLPPLIAPILALGRWKTFTLLAGSIPEDYAGFAPGVSLIPRLEWTLWIAVGAAIAQAPRPSFGDYGIAHPIYRYMPWWMRGAAKIRYTGLNDYCLFRGQSLKISRYGGYNQFRQLAAQVIGDQVYRGPGYSAGDKYIDDCANNRVGTGNLQKWVTVGTTQHVTYLSRLVTTIA
jgi:hypothetical protein